MKKICVFGDSIAFGWGDPDNGGWVNIINIPLLKNPETILYNNSVSDEDTNKILKRLDTECKSRNPDAIIFAIGINDSQHFGDKNKTRTNKNIFEQNFRKILDMSKKYTDKIYVLGLTNVNEKYTSPFKDSGQYFSNDVIEDFDKIIEKETLEQSCTYIPTKETVKLEDLADGIHINNRGHKKIANLIRSQVDNTIL